MVKNSNDLIMVPILIIFFIFQVFAKPSEVILTITIIVITLVTFRIHKNKREEWLFLLGFLLGMVIEVALGFQDRLQHWENASLGGVPYWLPLVWGYGFVMITRIGILVRGIK